MHDRQRVWAVGYQSNRYGLERIACAGCIPYSRHRRSIEAETWTARPRSIINGMPAYCFTMSPSSLRAASSSLEVQPKLLRKCGSNRSKSFFHTGLPLFRMTSARKLSSSGIFSFGRKIKLTHGFIDEFTVNLFYKSAWLTIC